MDQPPNLTLTRVVFESKSQTAEKVGTDYLTLTRVVFEQFRFVILYRRNSNLTLTRVVFELDYHMRITAL